MARTLPPQARTIIAGFGVSYLGTGLIMPVNVIYLSDVAHLAAPVVAAFYLLLPAFGLLGGVFGGRLVDQVGARQVGTVGFALQGLGWLIVPMSSGIAWVCGAAIVAGLGTGAAATALRSQLSLVCPPHLRGRAFAVRNLAVNIGAAVGALAVAALAVRHAVPYTALYVLNALSFWAFGLVMWRLTRQPAAASPSPPAPGDRANLLGLPGLVAGLTGHLLVFAGGLALVESVFPLILHDLLTQPIAVVGTAIAASTVTAVLVQLPVERLLRPSSARVRFAWHSGCWAVAWLLGAVAGASTGVVRTILVFTMMVFFSTGACIYHAAFQPHLSLVVPDERLGTANGLVSIAFNAGSILGASGFVLLLAVLSHPWHAFAVLGMAAAASAIALQRFAASGRPAT
ncbi:MFS transporter [Micromonospora andamanensis]